MSFRHLYVWGGGAVWDLAAVLWWRCLWLFSYLTEHLFNLVCFGQIRVIDLYFMTFHRVTFLYKTSWTIKLFLPLDSPSKPDLCHNSIDIGFQDDNVTLQLWNCHFKGTPGDKLNYPCKVMEVLSLIHPSIFFTDQSGIFQNSLCFLHRFQNRTQSGSLLSKCTAGPKLGSLQPEILGWGLTGCC